MSLNGVLHGETCRKLKIQTTLQKSVNKEASGLALVQRKNISKTMHAEDTSDEFVFGCMKVKDEKV